MFMSYTSILSFNASKPEDLQIMCINGAGPNIGEGPYIESCTIKVSGIVKLSVVYSLLIETLTKFN